MTLIKLPTLPTFKAMKFNLPNINNTVAQYTVRILLVAHILATSYWPSEYINIFQHLATRIVLAVLVVALLFWDIASGALLAILLVLSVQEAKSRQTGASVLTADLAGLKQMPKLTTKSTQETGLIPQSVYGQQQVPQMTSTSNNSERVGAYMDQIGELGISKQIQAGQGVQIVDGVPSVKVNMGQTSTQHTSSMTYLGKEGYQMDSTNTAAPTVHLGTGSAAPTVHLGTGSAAPTVSLGTEYDHPANKTISENLKAHATGFITDKNLQDAQINSITGLDGTQPPCFVASQSGIWNAQGFGSIARAVDDEDCPHSFV